MKDVLTHQLPPTQPEIDEKVLYRYGALKGMGHLLSYGARVSIREGVKETRWKIVNCIMNVVAPKKKK